MIVGFVADALALSRVADLGEVGITGPGAVAIAAFFGNLDEEENVELEALPQPLPLPAPLPESEPETVKKKLRKRLRNLKSPRKR